MNYDEFYVWHDKEIRFDVPKAQVSLREGEKVFDTIANIEDSKGSNGDVGTLIFSSLRIIWYLQSDIRLNLSIGYDCILSSETRSVASKVSGDIQALAIKCKFNTNRFEFVFNSISDSSPQLFSSFDYIYQAYDTSRLYREVKMKGFLTQDKNLITLPGENVLSKTPNVASIKNTEHPVMGTFYRTNVRIVWFSNTIDNFNVSLPWLVVKSIKLKDMGGKQGKLVYIETGKVQSGNMFTFRFGEKSESFVKELEDYCRQFTADPNFGVEIENNKAISKFKKSGSGLGNSSISSGNSGGNLGLNPNSNSNSNNTDAFNSDQSREKINNLNAFHKMVNTNEEVEVIETNYFNEQSNILYYMTNQQDKKGSITDVVFSKELGLAIERLPDNTTAETLWKIIL